jgi:hypothetical protein
LLRNGRDWINHVGTILTLSLGGLMFHALLYRARLVPRWLFSCGLAATVVTITASFLFMFRVVDLLTSVYMNLPLALLEVVFAAWLIARGVNPPVRAG